MGQSGRHAAAGLVFGVGGGRTVIHRQHVPYPIHITRPFYLDAARPDIATLYLQSASGGLYRGDDLTLTVDARKNAVAHLATQAATVVHATGTQPARQRIEIAADVDSVLAYTPDPLILFPDASLSSETRVMMDAGACVILADAFAPHDPQSRARPFASLSQRLEVTDRGGRVLVRELGRLSGSAMAGKASPLGAFGACGTLFVLAPRDKLPRPGALVEAAAEGGGLPGASSLPNGAGTILRLVGRDGSQVRRGLEAAFELAFLSATGIRPAPRRR